MEHTFENVTLYRSSEMFGNIIRTDVRTLTITEGQKYAQYNNATRIKYIPSGARKARAFMLTSYPFLVVVNRADAIEPESLCSVVIASDPGIEVTKSKYASFDNRWRSDFVNLLAARNIRALYVVNSEERNW